MGECYTDIAQCRTECKWVIREIDSHLELCEKSEDGEVDLASPLFYTRMGNDMIVWRLYLYLNRTSHESKDWISFGIACKSKEQTDISGHYKIYEVHAKEKKVEICRSDKLVTFEKDTILMIDKCVKTVSTTEDTSHSWPNNCLTIICELMFIGKPITIHGPRPIQIPECKLFEDYRELFDTRDCSDVTFVVDEEKIAAHKAILMARSPVFRAMFKHEMVENKENRVDITDITPGIFEELLRFIYTNEVRYIDELADDLLQAADKYEIKILKEICEASILHSINVKKAAQTLVFADNHNCAQLLVHTINFINKHGLDVLDTSGFKAMEKSHPHLVTAMYKGLLIRHTTGSSDDSDHAGK